MKESRVFNSLRSFFAKIMPWVVSVRSFFGKIMPWVVFLCLAIAMLFDPGRDTFGVASAAFAVAFALASVTFSYARTLKEDSAIRDELVFAGERQVLGAVMFLVASILKYASRDIPRYMTMLNQALPQPTVQQPDVTFPAEIIHFAVVSAAFIFFLLGLLCAQMGITILAYIAGYRAKRRPHHGVFFHAIMSYDEHWANLEKEDGISAPSRTETESGKS